MGLETTVRHSKIDQSIVCWLTIYVIVCFIALWASSHLDSGKETPGKKAEAIKPILLSKGKARYHNNIVQVVSINREDTLLGYKDVVTVKYDSGVTAKFVLFDAIKANDIQAM